MTILSRFFAASAVACLVGAQEVEYEKLDPGRVPEGWRTGGPNCLTVPDWQVQEYNEDFYILRESGCIHAEKPFLYLILGDNKALLEDTGVASDATKKAIPTAPVIQELMARWAARKKHAPVGLVVIHSHSHGDHTAADSQFQGVEGVEFIAAKPEEIAKAARIAKWPEAMGQIDLGGRVVDVIPIPGHDAASVALYDRRTGVMLTGDSLYPGRLYVREDQVPTFAASARRMVEFAKEHPVSHVLGTHIEQAAQAYADYPAGTKYQAAEHGLELTRGALFELDAMFQQMAGKAETVAGPDFTVVVRKAR